MASKAGEVQSNQPWHHALWKWEKNDGKLLRMEFKYCNWHPKNVALPNLQALQWAPSKQFRIKYVLIFFGCVCDVKKSQCITCLYYHCFFLHARSCAQLFVKEAAHKAVEKRAPVSCTGPTTITCLYFWFPLVFGTRSVLHTVACQGNSAQSNWKASTRIMHSANNHDLRVQLLYTEAPPAQTTLLLHLTMPQCRLEKPSLKDINGFSRQEQQWYVHVPWRTQQLLAFVVGKP